MADFRGPTMGFGAPQFQFQTLSSRPANRAGQVHQAQTRANTAGVAQAGQTFNKLDSLRQLLGFRATTQGERDFFHRTGKSPFAGFDFLGALQDKFGFGASLTGEGGELDNPFQSGIDKIAASREANIDEQFDDALNNRLASLQDRGLGGSTFALTAGIGTEREKQGALSDLSGDIGALEIQGTKAALDIQESQRKQQMQLLQSILGQIF